MAENSKLEYELLESQKVFARFGILNTSKGSFMMPCVSPGIRTAYDAKALLDNMSGGLQPQVITPYLSYRRSILPTLADLLGRSYLKKLIEPFRPLIIPDPESEALSFNCIARNNFKKLGDVPSTVKTLLTTGLTSNPEKGKPKVHSAWKMVRKDFGLSTVKEWAMKLHRAIGADVFLAPSPIMRGNPKLVKESFESGYAILDEAIAEAEFPMNGLHLLLHAELFKDGDEAAKARKEIYSELGKWYTFKERYSGIFLSFKIHDPSNYLTDPSSGSVRRRILSEFVTEISERVTKAKGATIGHNFGNWSIGLMDSGGDIATFRVSGEMRIDMPIKSDKKRKKGKDSKRIPPIFDKGTLSDISLAITKDLYKDKKAFPVPLCMESKDYWDLESYKDRAIYAYRTRCGTLVELGEEYREAGLHKKIPLREALHNRIMQSEIRQELIDLCPSIG